LHRAFQVSLARRQLCQPCRKRSWELEKLSCNLGRREPVRFGKDDVDAENPRMPIGNAPHQFGHPRPLPRPLPVFCEALVVDVDDHDSRRIARAGPKALFEIKNPQAQFWNESDVEGSQQHGYCDDPESGAATGAPEQGNAPAHRGAQIK